VPEIVAVCVYRIAQEALQNAVRHSGASNIDVALIAEDGHLTLRVRDEGNGFDPLSSQESGIGLITMRERVELSGGKLHVDTGSGDGTTIEAVLPLGGRSTDT
jgi:signal transduction histidine kinase